MTMKLPQKAGFVPTTAEWDRLVRIAENLAAQLAQARAECNDAQAVALAYILRAERAEMDANKWAILANGKANVLDAARAEVARLTAAIDKLIQAPKNGSGYEGFEKAYDELKALCQPAPAQGQE